jgi:hypothetical protein
MTRPRSWTKRRTSRRWWQFWLPNGRSTRRCIGTTGEKGIFEREFQTAIEACIDIAGLSIRAAGVDMPDTYADRSE